MGADSILKIHQRIINERRNDREIWKMKKINRKKREIDKNTAKNNPSYNCQENSSAEKNRFD